MSTMSLSFRRFPTLGVWQTTYCAASLLVAVAAALPAAASGVILDSHGFETPPYSLGPLLNQLTGSTTIPTQKWVTAGHGGSTAVVQNSVTESGSQALRVTRGANSDDRWAVPVTGFPTQRFVTIDWDMRVEQPAPASGFGPFFGVEAYDDIGPHPPGVLGALGVDTATRDVLYQLPGALGFGESGQFVTYGAWHNYRIVLDFQQSQYRAYFDHNQITVQSFVDGALTDFSDADIATFALSFDSVSQGLTGVAYFDNFLVRDGLVGDYDLDGDVDAADYTRWKTTFGDTVTPGTLADGNGNGLVDAADYTIWRDSLGASLFTFAGSGSAVLGTAIPEPTTLLLAAVVLLAGGCGRPRRR